jgi:hypothetical protein
MRSILLFAVASLTACATIDARDCQNPYDVGFRDALFGIQRQDDVYAPICQRNGVQLDVARYAQGWREGVYEFDARKAHGGVE